MMALSRNQEGRGVKQPCACAKCSNEVDTEDYASPLCPACYGEGCDYKVERAEQEEVEA